MSRELSTTNTRSSFVTNESSNPHTIITPGTSSTEDYTEYQYLDDDNLRESDAQEQPKRRKQRPILQKQQFQINYEQIREAHKHKMQLGVDFPITPSSGHSSPQDLMTSVFEEEHVAKPACCNCEKVTRALYRKIDSVVKKIDEIGNRIAKIENHIYQENVAVDVPVTWPISNKDQLYNVESSLRAGDSGLKKKLKSIFRRGQRNNMQIFLRDNLRSLLRHCGRFTWTGLTANCMKNTLNAPSSNCAADLLTVNILKDHNH
ncbi:uncharacterized protein LOC131683578 isoform X2 [Topomyia yanbarensis]|uniref:uncharacterized protein LOC131683578 isoform X2 n=1 Tax=Topomyia yanbarensis TaxID=2498891 RepID=UPI00273BE190|nr:uncharacterized protein LOC131683578 isoform X2 [Topomyia yanbarensis]